GRSNMIKCANHALNDIVDISKVTAVMAIVKYIDRFACENLFGENEQRHIGATPGTINGEETQTGGGDIKQMAVSMSHQFIGFFGRSIKTDRMINVVMYRKRHGGVSAINGAAGGVNQMLGAEMATSLQDIQESGNVGIDVCLRI